MSTPTLSWIVTVVWTIILISDGCATLLLHSCGNWTVEVEILFDVSQSFEDDYSTYVEGIPTALQIIQDEFPGSKFGVGVFSSKRCFRNTADICYHDMLPLTKNLSSVETTIRSLEFHSESGTALDALFHSVRSSIPGWSFQKQMSDAIQWLPIVILWADGKYFLPGDIKNDPYDHCDALIPHDGRAEAACELLDVASEDMVVEVYQQYHIHPLFLIPAETEVEARPIYEELNKKIGTVGRVITVESKNPLELAAAILDAVEDITCAVTPAPPDVSSTDLTYPSTSSTTTSTISDVESSTADPSSSSTSTSTRTSEDCSTSTSTRTSEDCSTSTSTSADCSTSTSTSEDPARISTSDDSMGTESESSTIFEKESDESQSIGAVVASAAVGGALVVAGGGFWAYTKIMQNNDDLYDYEGQDFEDFEGGELNDEREELFAEADEDDFFENE